MYLIFEVCEGGELFDRIIDKVPASEQGFFSEDEARDLFTQIMRGLNYCHKNGVIHRDIKPENLIFSSTTPNSMLKVIDFGLSKLCKTDEEVIEEARLKRANSQKTRQPRKQVSLKTVAGTVVAR